MSALEEERTDARVGGAALRRQQLDLGWRKKVGQRPECGVVLLDIVGERRDPRLGFDRAGAGVKCRHRAAERVLLDIEARC
jgi:hypothetical protein